MIYVVLNCALFGSLIRFLLFWRYLVVKLKSLGFQENPYNPFVMKKVISESLCTICWHMDYLKISHMQSTVVDGVLRRLEVKYRKVYLIKTTQGKVHNYLLMLLDFINKFKLRVKIQSTYKVFWKPHPWTWTS